MTRTCLVTVYGPQNIIPAIAAVKYYGIQKNRSQKPNVITLVHTPGLQDSVLEGFRGNIGRITESHGWNAPIILTNKDMGKIIGHDFPSNYSEILRRFKTIINFENIDEIYYVHNHSGRATELCLNAYPNADVITTGDAFGYLYDAQYFQFISGKRGSIRNALSNTSTKVKTYFYNIIKPEKKIDIVAILPIDWSGNYTTGKNLYVVPKQTALNVIQECSKSFQDIDELCNIVIEKTNEPRYLLLLTNFSDGNVMSIDAEAALYEEIIRSVASKNSSILVKPHPLSNNLLSEIVCKRLEADYLVLELPSKLNQYPIEFLNNLFLQCQIIAFSSAIVTLKYFYDRKIIYPMTEQLIEKYFPEASWLQVKDFHRTYCSQLKKLSTWDEKSLLWKGYDK